MRHNNSLTVTTYSSVDPNHWIAEGRNLAKKEGTGVFETIERLFGAETSEAGATIEAMRAKGAKVLERYQEVQDRLVALGFDAARYLRAIARGKVDLWWAIALMVLNAVLAGLVLTFAKAAWWMTVMLAGLVMTTALPVEEFFTAHHERKSLREGVFLVLSLLALAATFWLGTLRGVFMLGVNTESVGPATEALHNAGTVLRFGLGILAVVAELLAGYKWFLVRQRLFSTMASTAKKRDELANEMVALQSGIKAVDAEPAIRREYRVVGARQYLAQMARGESTEHLRKAIIGALVAIVVLIGLFFITSIASAEPAPKPRLKIAMVDLTKSSDTEDFKANIKAVESMIDALPNNTRIVVTGIADGFGSPRFLLDHVVRGEGSFGLELQASRELARSRWMKTANDLKLEYGNTSVVGSIALLPYIAGERFDLVIFSDGRETVVVNLAHVAEIDVAKAIERVKKANGIPALPGVRVHMLGVSPNDKTPAYLRSLRAFWEKYFEEAGAELVTFRIDRTLP